MSGHSKWHNIKRQKGANDAKRSQIFSKISRLISVAAKEGGGDPDSNARLRLAVQKAKDERMPKENIDRAIKKGIGALGGAESFEEITYEAFGPGGGGILIYCLTDNKNRTVSELRNMLNNAGGKLGTAGSAAYIFNPETKEPTFEVSLSAADISKVEGLLDAIEDNDDVLEVYHNYKFS